LNIEKNILNEKKIESIIEKYGKKTAYRYIEDNNQADLLVDKAIDSSEIKVPIINKYQNKYLIKSTRKKSIKKGNKDQVINTRIRTTIKKQIRTQFSSNVFDKEWYDIIKQYKEETSKLSDKIFRDKRLELENSQKMISRMIHGSLPTCEKINRLIEVE
jgi:hypothetical protein